MLAALFVASITVQGQDVSVTWQNDAAMPVAGDPSAYYASQVAKTPVRRVTTATPPSDLTGCSRKFAILEVVSAKW